MPLTTVDQGLLSTNAQYTGFKNRLINGDMVIDQRGSASSPVSNTAAGNTYFVDRWHVFGAVAARMNGRQSTVVPSSTTFTNSSLITSLAATTPGSGDAYGVRQIIEGFNAADLGWGTANAQTVTMSFWVRSSIAGTYSFSPFNGNEGGWRAYVATYTINSVDTWEYKTITIPGDTSGTWNKTNGPGIQCWWDLGSGSGFNTTAGSWNGSLLVRTSGSASWIGTNGATFYITGAQLEKGSTATSFDVLPYGTELALCQRYYYRVKPQSAARYCLGRIESSTNARGLLPFPTTMRVAPSALEQTGTATDYGIAYAGTGTACSSVPVFDGATTESVARISFTISSGMTQGQVCDLYNVNANGYLGWSAEL